MILLYKHDIQDLVDDVAHTLTFREYKYKKLVGVVIMKGAFMFAADLVRKWDIAVDLDFIHVQRGYSIGAPGTPKMLTVYEFKPKTSYILIDVIAEKGTTFEYVKSFIPDKAEVVTCSLIVKGNLYTPTVFGKRLNTPKHLQGYGMGPRRDLSWVEDV